MPPIIKNLVALVLLGQPLIAAIGQKWHRRQPLVLLYHGVTDQTAFSKIQHYHGKWIAVDAFRRQIRWLKKHFTLAPLAEIERLVLERRPAAKPLAAITFDDGYRNNFRSAFPILQAEAVPATFFLAGDFVQNRRPLWIDRLEFCLGDNLAAYARERRELKTVTETEKEHRLSKLETATGRRLVLTDDSPYAPLNLAEIKMMADAGMTFGAHTMSHPILSRLDRAAQAEEILASKKLIEERLGACPHFAYPNGQPDDWNQATLEIIKEAGWRAAWTTLPRRVRPERDEPLTLPRITIANYHDDYRFRALVSGLVPR